MKSAEDLLSEITDPAMRARLASIHQGIKKCQRKQTQKPKSAEIVQLPLWPELARGVPNCSSLITSGVLLDNIRRFQLRLFENIRGLVLRLIDNVLTLSDNSLITSISAYIK